MSMFNEDKKIKVMVVDDEAFNAMIMEQHLKDIGCDLCPSAATGEEAIDHAQNDHPDLIFMDICLNGDLDGIEAAKRIKEQIKTSIVFISGYSYEEYKNRIHDINPLTSLSKPLDYENIESVIHLYQTSNS